jgi:hypothetical protein
MSLGRAWGCATGSFSDPFQDPSCRSDRGTLHQSTRAHPVLRKKLREGDDVEGQVERYIAYRIGTRSVTVTVTMTTRAQRFSTTNNTAQ